MKNSYICNLKKQSVFLIQKIYFRETLSKDL
jgi:hypothetical protein